MESSPRSSSCHYSSPTCSLTVDVVNSSCVARVGKRQPGGQMWLSQIRPLSKNGFCICGQLHITLLYKYQHNVFSVASWDSKPKIFTIWPFAGKVYCPLLYIIMIVFAIQYHPTHHCFIASCLCANYSCYLKCLASTITK